MIDINGQGVAGASIQLVGILWHPSGKLDEWLAALDAEKVAYPVTYRLFKIVGERRPPVAVPPGHGRPRGALHAQGRWP